MRFNCAQTLNNTFDLYNNMIEYIVNLMKQTPLSK